MNTQDPEPADPTEGADLGPGGRRDLLKKLAVGGAIVWAAPAIARTASAQDSSSEPPTPPQLVRQRWTISGTGQNASWSPAPWADPVNAPGQWSGATTVTSGVSLINTSGNVGFVLTAGGTFTGSPNVWYRKGTGIIGETAPDGSTSYQVINGSVGGTQQRIVEIWVTWSRPAA